MDVTRIEDAKVVLNDITSKTPIVHATKIHDSLWIKAENLQGTGAFKLRGAYYKLSKLSEEEKAKGVIAASAGNHAQGVAYACMKMGIKGTIVMPKTAPLSKIEATRSYGVDVELQEILLMMPMHMRRIYRKLPVQSLLNLLMMKMLWQDKERLVWKF